MRNRAIVILGLFIIAGAIYWPVRNFGFIDYDDPTYVSQNPHLQEGFTPEFLHHAFTAQLVGNWCPLVWISFDIDQLVFQRRPAPMHVENVAMHLLAAVILFLALIDATGATWRSGLVAALFLCHPMHVESVAWISSRKDVLSTVLLFAAIGAYIRYVRGNRPTLWYIAMLFAFALSLMTKSMGVTLPAVLILLDYWPLRRLRSAKHVVLEKLPLLAIALIVVVLTAIAQKQAGAPSSLDVLGVINRIENAFLAYVSYMAKLVAPTNLAVFYPHPEVFRVGQVLAAAMLLLLITAAAFGLRKNQPCFWIGWLWFLGTLVPVIGLVQVGSQAMADRYSYFSSVGFFIAIVWGVWDRAAKSLRSQQSRGVVLGGCAIAILTTMSLIARNQVGYWRDTQTLFAHAAEVTDDNYVAHLELGNVAFQNGDLSLAEQENLEVLRIQPHNAKAYNNLAECVLRSSPERAVPLYEKAVEYDPTAPNYHVNLAAALVMTGQRDAALEQCRIALKLQPGFASALAAVADLTHAQPQ